MRILHYSLGFPPYRTGGLIKFCMDVMIQQFRMGHQVALLWPGQIRLLQSRTVIKQRKTIIINGAHITNLEIINPLPIPYDEGITNIKYFIHKSI